ncbi:MAG: OmpA family protein [Acidobacteriota bacterium]
MRSTTLITLTLFIFTTGCATRGFVRREAVAVEERLGQKLIEAEDQIEQNQNDIAQVEERTTTNEQEITELSQTAQDALDRAVAAGKLAEGKFLYETVLADDKVRFGFDQVELSSEAHAALDSFATGVKSTNEDVYIEIQGHTDAIGSETYNQKLGLRRAEAVRDYLSKEQGFALHRMAVISYGEEAPLVENDNRENRSKNRRVMLVVLK